MNNQMISFKRVLSVLLVSLILPAAAMAQSAGTGSKMMYAGELDQIAKKTVDSVKKIKLPTAPNWEDKYKAAAALLKTADDLDWNAEKTKVPPVSITPLLPLTEYGLSDDDQAFFAMAYSVSGETWSLDRKTKRPKEDNDRLALICSGILRQDADRVCADSINAYLEIINSVTAFYTESAGMKTTRSGSVAEKEALIADKIGTLYFMAALLGTDTATADSALTTYHTYASKYARLNDEDLIFEYDRLITALNRQVQDDLVKVKRKAETEKAAVDELGALPAEGPVTEAKAAADKAMAKASSAQTAKKEREAALAFAEAGLQYARCKWQFSSQGQTTVVTGGAPDATALEGLKKDLSLVKTLLALGATGTTGGFTRSVDMIIRGTEQLAGGMTAEAVKLFADAEKTLASLVESHRESSGDTSSIETGDSGTTGDNILLVDTVDGDLASHQKAFDGYLAQMAAAQDKGDFTAAAEYYKLAQGELAAIEAIKTSEARQKILVAKQNYNELLSVTVTLNEGIRPDKKKQGYLTSMKKTQETSAQAEQILGAAKGYTDFVRASQLYYSALAELQKLNREILAALKGQLQNDRSALESGNAVQGDTGSDQGQQGSGKPYVLPF
jgi:hypothetical protein